MKHRRNEVSTPHITPEQLEVLHVLLEDYKEIAIMILDQWQLKSLSTMPRHKFITALRRILELRDHFNSLRKS